MLTSAEIRQLNRMLDRAEGCSSSLTENERRLIERIDANLVKQGGEMELSDRDWFALHDIALRCMVAETRAADEPPAPE